MHDGRVRVQVECRHGTEPRAFFVGGRRLQVMRVLERAAENNQRRFRVRVPDGREFVLRLDANTGEWTLARIAAAARGRARPAVRGLFVILFLLVASAGLHAQPTNKPLMLVATPAMQGLYSRTALIVVPAGKHHLGFIVNRATAVRLAAVLPQHAASAEVLDPVHFGGPDMADTLFAVVRGNPGADALPLFGELYLATSAAALVRVMEQSPGDARFFAGFVAWEQGELQKELSGGNWYVTDADAGLFFQRDTTRLWEELVERLGSAQTAAAASSTASHARARSNPSTAHMKAGRSSGRRAVTRLPLTTAALSW